MADMSKFNKKSVNLLPALFRTDKNSKFLSATLDQLIQTPQLERISGWVGSTNTKTYNPSTDFFIKETLPLRKNYQLEPAVVVRDDLQNIKKTLSYDDLINQVAFDGGLAGRHDRLFKPEFYSYDPHIDWDKFVNFNQYYWLPVGPNSVRVSGLQESSISEYTIVDSDDGLSLIVSPDGLTPNVSLTLYRGITYKFTIDSKRKIWIKKKHMAGATQAVSDGIINNGISQGTITLTVDDNTPLTLWYIAEDDIMVGGEIVVKSIEEDSKLNIETEILGKKTFTSGNGIEFTNGLKVQFVGNVTPAEYIDRAFFVEGVGDKIKLIDVNILETPEAYSGYYNENFDGTPFDDYPFDNYGTLPIDPEYVTINRASEDRNPWSRYNRWFHKDVIEKTALYNNVNPEFLQDQRATRPIIEFKPNIQLFNFGSLAKSNIHHVDTNTTDAFSDVEGQYGYYVDGVKLEQGDRVMFLADPDPMVYGKIFLVNFLNLDGSIKLSLEEETDSMPNVGECVLVTKGTENRGTCWHYTIVDGVAQWVKSQQKESLNQAPLFDIFDKNGNSYGDSTYYQSDFVGTRMFGYGVGTGANDSVLGFPLLYKSVANQSYYLFKNYFTTDIATVVEAETTYNLYTKNGFLKRNLAGSAEEFINVWTPAAEYIIPIIQTSVIQTATDSIEITAINNPGYQTVDVQVYVNEAKQFVKTDYTLYAVENRYFVNFKNALNVNDRVLLKLFTDVAPTPDGYYETPINYTNNPLNGPISEFTLAELTDHVKTMADRHPDFAGSFYGTNNVRDLQDFAKYGTRLISNKTPAVMASLFLADKENNIVSVIRKSSKQYEQFKLGILNKLTSLSGTYKPQEALDIILHNMNVNKDINFPYSYSDMVAYGKDVVTRTWTVTDSRNVEYAIVDSFDPNALSFRSVLVYLTSITTGLTEQLILGVDYDFNTVDATVVMARPLVKGDIIVINDYASTQGCYVPPTPSKLGLYPKYVPSIFVDDTYANASQLVIQGHDGSITIAYGDYRDDIILELEKRIYNNIKVNYNPEIFDINEVLPGVFRTKDYSYAEVQNILKKEFLKWAGFYGFDYELNDTATDDPKTFNYKSANDINRKTYMPGGWRAIFKFYYDTDRPHTCPWEMLGFPSKPLWWEETYGPAPYTNGNTILWGDLENGYIADPANPRTNTMYARPGLSGILPVDSEGNLLNPAAAGIAHNLNSSRLTESWIFGDSGPVESAWRRSSAWPFALQILLALARPAKYCSTMFDTSRLEKNLANQFTYNDHGFITPASLKIHLQTNNGNKVQSSGYSVLLSEINRQRSRTYITDLTTDIANTGLQLMNKVGGFVSKDKLEVIIDSVNPSTTNPGVALPPEDYDLFLNHRGNPIRSVSVSGIIVERTASGYVLRGYDRNYPFFNCYYPITAATDPAFTVGGKTESYLVWSPSETDVGTEAGPTAVVSSSYKFYQEGQLVYYNNSFYRVKVSHRGGTTFDNNYFVKLPTAPIIGGVSVQKAMKYSSAVTQIPYGKEFYNIQDLYYAIMGYGKWLETQGLVLDEFNQELSEILDWNFTSKELLFWTTQNWAPGSVITLSPFANGFKFTSTDSIVDNLTDNFYEYSVLKADGGILDDNYITTARDDGVFSIRTLNTAEGIYFVRINFVQKEHAIVLNNYSIFGDVIYDVESGYRQRRIKLNGFRTANWNGDLYSPGFIYDEADINEWAEYTDYSIGDVVRYIGNYYTAIKRISGSTKFDFTEWQVLGDKPIAQLLPNFDYKINQFEDFYSLDIDNFDAGQQKLAQHLVGYTPRPYLENIFVDQISQYKFYQGFIKEKGTRNSIEKLAKASLATVHGNIDFNEEWAFRIGAYGSFTTDQNIEVSLNEIQFRENPQIIKFVDSAPINPNDPVIYKEPAEVLIKPLDYTSSPFDTVLFEDIEIENNFPTAGYVRLDDVTATALNQNSILSIANNRALNEGDTIWVGFTSNGDWDVLRYTNTSVRVAAAVINSPGQSLLLTTTGAHNLRSGDIISISQLETLIDGVYVVQEVTARNQFIVSSTLVSVNPTLTPGVGLLFAFKSVRFATFDDLLTYRYISDIGIGEKVWVDDAGQGNWGVFEKVDAYADAIITDPTASSLLKPNGLYGYKVVGSSDGTKWLVSSPETYSATAGYGKVYAYRKDGIGNSIVNVSNMYFNTGLETSAGFGKAIALDGVNDVAFVGAPNANNNAGLVECYSVDFNKAAVSYEFTLTNSVSNSLFGHDIAQTDNKILVSSPGARTVSLYNYSVSNSVITVNTLTAITITTGTNNAMFGSSIGIAKANGSIIAVAANESGAVHVFDGSGIYKQTISYDSLGLSLTDKFGDKVIVSSTGDQIIIAAPNVKDSTSNIGKVYIYKSNTASQFVLDQTIAAPISGSAYFGSDISIEDAGDVLAVSAIGTKSAIFNTFDSTSTTFDSQATNFYSTVKNSGSVYVYNKYGNKFVYAQELTDNSLNSDRLFGESVYASDNVIMVGAPGRSTSNHQDGSIVIFDKGEDYNNSWNLLRQEDTLVDISKLRTVYTLDTKGEKILDYLDIVDPMKGRIPGIAEQELTYQTVFDPAVYSLGNTVTINDTNANWIDEHVGELWWDLSSVKFVWYEQGELEYRRNNWGGIFPGCTVDVYEWVRSTYMPSQWAAIADTNEGLVAGISGQPKYADNSVMSVKQIYNAVTQTFTNVYYFWVRNKVTVPTNTARRLSAFEVASSIADPRAYGLKYISLIDNNALMIANAKPSLNESNIHLSVEIDGINSTVNKHTEWLLLAENDERSVPNTLLKKKLFDSLLGRDSLGNLVPDPALPDRLKYGVEVRPRQSMFRDRFGALRIVVEYVNSILKDKSIVGNYSFKNLNDVESIPNINLNQYDVLVEDIIERDMISSRFLRRASLSCVVTNGRITSVEIIDQGLGYRYPPTVSINGSGSGAEIKLEIDSVGSVISATIKSSGKNYTVAPTLTVRPFAVIVQSDSTVNNKWSKYEWDYIEKTWGLPTHVQNYDTTNYWKYIDWIDPSFNPAQDFLLTVDEPYQLSVLTNVPAGNYIKIRNAGDGRSIIVKKILDSQQPGTYNVNYDLVYQETGTIQLLDSIWDYSLGNSGFDFGAAFDQTLFDRVPDKETENIIRAISEDIFTGELQIHFNKLFFKLVRYALTEQKFLDWAFKTSFIDVTNNAGTLDQRSTYKLNDVSYYESYVNETKPYHTKIRNFTSAYTASDMSFAKTTDFDLPSYYDSTRKQFIPVSLGSSKLAVEPYKSWYDNYTYYVGSIDLFDGGSGYLLPPEIVIKPADGDNVTDHATAVAQISLGKVTAIQITHPGSGYTASPTVIIQGGGDPNLTPAKAGAKLENKKIRSNLINIKFDRVAGYNEVTTSTAYDVFSGNGSSRTYNLTWFPDPNKSNITVKVDGILELSSNYDLTISEQKFNGYTKKYGSITLNSVPGTGTNVEVSYLKNVKLYNATDRIRDYYSPVSGMPGNTATLLMAGLEYPGVSLETLPFKLSTGWGTTGWDDSTWDDYTPEEGLYEISTVTNTTSTFILPYTPTAGQYINVYINNARVDDLYFNSYDGVTVQPNGRTTATTGALLQTFQGDGVTNYISFNPQLTSTSTISFRYQDSDGTTMPTDIDLDTMIYGGTFVGQNQTESDEYNDINIDGDAFISSINSYGPEENVPGRVLESLGISVYTKPPAFSPLIITKKYFTSGNTTTFRLGQKPANDESVVVLWNSNQLLAVNEDFTIDYYNNTITTTETLPAGGVISITVIGVGSSAMLESATARASTTSTTSMFTFSSAVEDVKDSYVTVNGVKKIPNVDYRVVGTQNNYASGRAAIKFLTGISVGDVIQVWFFSEAYKSYSEIYEQYITTTTSITTTSTEVTTTATSTSTGEIIATTVTTVSTISTPITTYALEQPPGAIKPYHSQVIVEVNGRRLTPPDTLYFEVQEGQLDYPLNEHYDYPAAYLDETRIEVYINGERAVFGEQIQLLEYTNTIRFGAEYIRAGDVIAIVNLIKHDYVVEDNNLVLTDRVSLSTVSNSVRIVTFTNHDSSHIRKERFPGVTSGRFILSRKVLDSNYVWVEVNGHPLTQDLEYKIDTDKQTIILNSNYQLTAADTVNIMSLADNVTQFILGYRMFTDFLGRTSFKRLSSQNSTRLSSPLSSTDTSIVVVNGNALIPPNAAMNRPGIILVNGERIEFFQKDGNVLSQIKRGTFGTGVRAVHPAGTTVIDQSPEQNIPTYEYVQEQQINVSGTLSDEGVVDYSTATLAIMTVTNGITNIVLDSIVFSTVDDLGNAISLDDQIQVYYQGTRIYNSSTNKRRVIHNYGIAYDSDEVNSSNVSSDIELTADYYVNTSTYNLVLNFVPDLGSQVKVVRNFGNSWSEVGKTLHESNSEQTKFLLERPATLPDKYQYGQ